MSPSWFNKMITLKTTEQIERMRHAGRIVRLVLNRLGDMVAPGITTAALDAEAERLAKAHNAECLFKGFPGTITPFPNCTCISINEQVVHGIPSNRIIAAGDIVSIDFGVRLDSWCGDAAETFIAAPQQTSDRVLHLVAATRNTLEIAIKMCRPQMKWSDIARTMQDYVEGEGFSIVKDLVGHGIGSEMHEPPSVPNFVSPVTLREDFTLVEGMVIAIEPMVNIGSLLVQGGKDGWTITTQDKQFSAHFEHTIAITATGASVLTDGS